jgi:hypothetical protein
MSELIAVGSSGVYRLNGNPAPDRPEMKILGVTIPSMGSAPYQSLGPKPSLALADPFSAAMDPVSGDVVDCRAGTLRYLRREKDGTYTRGLERTLENGDDPTALALFGETIVVVRQGGRVLLPAARDFTTRQELRLTIHDDGHSVGRLGPTGSSPSMRRSGRRLVEKPWQTAGRSVPATS